MKPSERIRRRLANQRLVDTDFKTPAQVVAALGAVQAQDFYGGLWGLGLRLPPTTERKIEEWFADGRILRFHILRPTWHFVAREDVRWMLALSAPRLNKIDVGIHVQLGVNAALMKRSTRIIEKALRGGVTLTRTELGRILDQNGVRIGSGDGQRLGHIMYFAELDGLVTSGPRRGKQFTYALLDERVPPAKTWARQDALAELALRYFATRGPATARDFAWWSGLTLSDCRKTAVALDSELGRAEIDGETHWWSEARPPAPSLKGAWLLPNYDEYGIGYADRSLIFDAELFKDVQLRDRPIFSHFYMVDGRALGTWRRTATKTEMQVSLSPFEPPLPAAQLRALKAAARRYADFVELDPVVEVA